MYLLDLNKKEQKVFDDLMECLIDLDKSVSKMVKTMKLEISDTLLENIQPMIEVTTWIGIAIVIVIGIFNFADMLIEVKLKATLDSVTKPLIMIGLGVMAVQYAPDVCLLIVKICNQIMVDLNVSVDAVTMSEVFMDSKEVAKKIEELNWFGLQLLKLDLYIPKSVMFLGSGFMRLVSFIRKIFVELYLILSPIGFSMVAAKGFKGTVKFILSFIGYVGQGVIATILFKLYQINIAEEVFAKDSIISCMWNVTILTGILIYMVLGASKPIKDLF